jgi:hypothetical protein
LIENDRDDLQAISLSCHGLRRLRLRLAGKARAAVVDPQAHDVQAYAEFAKAKGMVYSPATLSSLEPSVVQIFLGD